MVSAAVWILTIAVALGTLLALWHLRMTDDASRPPFAVGIAHGVIGTGGLVLLLLALRGPPRGVEAGAAYFGAVSAGLLGAALLTGIGVLAVRRKAVVIAVHAGIAITGYVLVLAWSAVG